MDSKESRPDTGEAGGVALTKPTPSRPTLALPSRFPADALIRTPDASPSPMTLVSSFFAEHEPETDRESYSQLMSGTMTSLTPKSTEGPNSIEISSAISQSNIASGAAVKDAGNQGPGGRADPGVARSSTARFKTMTPSRLPIPRSPYLTIPPGLSPTTLLDSPVLLSTAQAEPSPTTGSFPLPPFIHGSGSTNAPASDILTEKNSEQDDSPSFVFKPFPKLGRNPLSTLVNMGPFGFSHQQVLAEVQAQAHAQIPSSVPPSTGATSIAAPVSTGPLVTSVNVAKLVPPLQCKGPVELTSKTLSEPLEKVHLPQLPAAPLLVERPSEDGYNWRKYGQKQVKGSEYPRSYYKCTYPNCPVKKKVERSYDGQVTEIVYKGEHNHPKPQATRRMSVNTSHLSDSRREGSLATMASGKIEGSNSILNTDGLSQVHPSDLKGERMTLVSDPTSSTKGPFIAEVSGTTEPSSGSTSDDEGEDGCKAEDGEEDGPDSKRRKKEKAKEAVTMVPLRTIREPRVVVQTTSDVDILDDGYRWRKYGQKVVKGNPHPRSYYKCTNLGCSVRKHVERSSTDPKAVITTYEGKHNHDVPAARGNNSHDITASVVSSAPLPAPAHTGFGGNAVTKPSASSLQDQFYLGKLLEDRLKASERMTMGSDLSGNGGIVNGVISSDQQNRGHAGMEISSQTSIGLMNSVITANRPLESNESFGQSLVLIPKEEQGDIDTLGSSIQSAFPSRPSSFCQAMPERLVLGP